jgi:hypothetical protein
MKLGTQTPPSISFYPPDPLMIRTHTVAMSVHASRLCSTS